MSLYKLNHPIFGVIIPLEEENACIIQNMAQVKKISITGVSYYIGKIGNKNIILVNSGIGKTNASAITTRLINDFSPKLILLLGSAGNINSNVKKGDVIIGKNVTDIDFGIFTADGMKFQYDQYLRNPQTNTVLPLEFSLDKHLVEKILTLNKKDLPKMRLGKIATSDALPNQPTQIKLLRKGNFDVAEMEGASVMQIGWLFNTSCMVIRGVSNNVEDSIEEQDIQLAADNAAKVLISFISNY